MNVNLKFIIMKRESRLVTEFVKKSLVLGGVLLFFAGTAQNNDNFKKCDKDGDKKISKTEFSDRYSSDDDNLRTESKDMQYDENKFYESSYELWDTDNDNRLSEDEWRTGYESSYGDYVEDDFTSYDANQNKYLEREEYQSSLSESDYYSNTDKNKDQSLDNKEYSTVVFECADKNRDSYLDEDEFKDYHESMQ